MLTDRRRFWFTLLFLCLFAPFAALLVISLTSPSPRQAATTPPLPTASNADATSPGVNPFGGIVSTPPAHTSAPLLAAGDGHQVWVLQPGTDNGTPGFNLFTRSANTKQWHLATHNGSAFWPSQAQPRTMTLEIPRAGLPGDGPYVFNELGWVDAYSLDDSPRSAGLLPPTQTLLAAAGGVDQLFAVTQGPPIAGNVFDPLPSSYPDVKRPVPAPASMPASAPATATAPATTTSATTTATTTAPETAAATSMAAAAEPATFNVYWYPPSPTEAVTTTGPSHPRPKAGSWCILPPLGTAADHASAPPENAMMALAERDGTLVAFWIDTPAHELVARTLDYRDNHAAWTPPVRSALPEDINGTRLLPVRLDDLFYLFWPVPTGDSVELHGGRIELHPGPTAYTLPAKNLVAKPLALGKLAQGISVADDVAIAPAENTLLVVLLTHDAAHPRVSMLFDVRGVLLSGPDDVEPHPPAHESQVGQNIAMLLMALMLTLSLWQWRQRSAPFTVPPGTVLAPLHLRASALFIDLLLPYLLAQVLFGGFENGPLSLITAWTSAMSHPEELASAVDLMVFVGIYFLHTTIGEAIYQRSLGKSLVGIRVVTVDGAKPGFGAILARNIIRLPELALALGPLYVLISDRRQRLGDMVARTLVVAPSEETEKTKGK